MKVERLPLSAIKLDPANARKHDERNLEATAASLSRFGQQTPIVIDADNVIRKGNGTYIAAKRIGLTEIYVVRTTLSGPEVAGYAIADNRTSDLSDWDEASLKSQIDAMEAVDPTLRQVVAFTDDELQAILDGAAASAGDWTGSDTPSDSDAGNEQESETDYTLVFDDAEQFGRWHNFLRYLRRRFPHEKSVAARLDRFLLATLPLARKATAKAGSKR